MSLRCARSICCAPFTNTRSTVLGGGHPPVLTATRAAAAVAKHRECVLDAVSGRRVQRDLPHLSEFVDQPQPLAGLRAGVCLCSDLVEVWILRHFRRSKSGGHQVADWLTSFVRHAVDALRPDREVDSLAFGKLPATFAGAKRWAPAEDYKQLLRPMVEMERNPVSRSEFVDTRTETDAAR